LAVNKIGREVPEHFEGIGELKAYKGPFDFEPTTRKFGRKISKINPGESKIIENIEKAILVCELKDGMTISFHHHFREGDFIVNMVVDAIAKLGIKDITIAPSSLNSVHAHLIEHIKNGLSKDI